MSQLPVVVLDPGHGGPIGRRNRGSSWNRAQGVNGLLEKDVAFDLALRTASRLRDHARVEITRSAEGNPSLSERADVARRHHAAVFLSLHLNGSHDPTHDGTDVYVAPDALPPSRAFGERVWHRLVGVTGASRGGLSARDLGTLSASRHAPDTAACLAEIAYLTNERQARALEEEGYRNRLADALTEAIREQVAASAEAVAEAFQIGEGSPFVTRALADCDKRCQELRTNAAAAGNPNRIAADRILRETGVAVDANPYVGITPSEIEAVIRSAFHARSMPEILLALWAKEGSTRSVSTPVAVPQASSDANARTLFRSKVFYEDLGLDHFIATRYDPAARDNVWDDRDSAAGQHEARFTQGVRQLLADRFLSEDIAGAINRELSVTRSGAGSRNVVPSIRFYSLCLIMADAFWSKLQATTFPLLPSLSDGLNYVYWNVRDFGAFLRSADEHRQEPRHQANGQPISIEQWALHTPPAANEYGQPRTNAIKFLHYAESYRPIFRDSITLIKPGIEDLERAPTGTRAAELQEPVAESLAPAFFANTRTFVPPPEAVAMDLILDRITGSPHAMTRTATPLVTRADMLANLPSFAFQETPAASGDFARMTMSSVLPLLPFFDVTDPARVKVVLQSVICYPADPAHPDRLAGRGRFPVVIIVHGNHDPVSFTSTPTGAAPLTTLGGQTIIPANPTTATAIPSHAGYSNRATGPSTEYLQEELAHRGFVSMSVDENCANFLNADFTLRADLILAYIDQLKRLAAAAGPNRFRDRLDFNHLALIGHSRGGDAVVEVLRQNRSRPAKDRLRIRCVVSIAPTDITGEMAPTTTGLPLRVGVGDDTLYCVIYGSHDGDVRGDGNGSHGGTGFSYYDRSNTHRAMAFIHGATHNRFNRVWNDLPNDGDPSHTAADTSDPRLLTRTQHEALAKEYIVGWLRYALLSDWDQQQLFDGSRANSLGTDVSLQWKFGRDLRTVEDCDTGTPTTNTMGGAVTPASVSEVRTHDQNDVDPAFAGLPGLAAVRRPTFPNDDVVLKAIHVPSGRARVREDIPAARADVSAFSHLTFRVTRKYPIDSPTFSTEPLPDVDVSLIDGAGTRRTVDSAAVWAQNPRKTRPYQRRGQQSVSDSAGVEHVVTRNFTKCNLETWRVPIKLFAGHGLRLNDIRAIEITFGAPANQPVYVDTISFVKL